MRVKKEVLDIGEAMRHEVADLARRLMEMTAEKSDGFVEISLA